MNELNPENLEEGKKTAMKKMFTLSICALLTLAPSLWAGDEDNPYAKLQKPGDSHEVFKSLAGEWDVIQKVWEQPGQPGKVNKGTMTRSLKFGGRFLEDVILVKEKGKVVKTVALHGYSNWSKKYQTTVYHDNDTGMYHYAGRVDKSGQLVMTSSWSMDTNGQTMKVAVRAVFTRSENKEVMVLYFKYPNVPEHKAAEMIYTRRSSKTKLY